VTARQDGRTMHDAGSSTYAIEYPRTTFAVGAALTIVGIALCALLALDAIEDFARAVWSITAAGLGLLLFAFILPTMLTRHALDREGLHLHMGLLINRTIPLSAIREVGPETTRRSIFTTGIGVRQNARLDTLFVTSSFRNLVSIRLNRELKLGGLMAQPVGNVVVSVSDIEGFLDAVAAVGDDPEA
jgi:hypothetical protein